MKNVCILGATGSIGTQTLDVLRKEKESFKLIAVSANTDYNKMIKIIDEFNPQVVAMAEQSACIELNKYCKSNNLSTEILEGLDGLNKIAVMPEVDIVVTSVVGMVGLVPTLNAIKAGKDIALANKETLVVGGKLVFEAADRYGVKILPVDSEHCAIFQCLQGNNKKDVDKIILTASGGPFRGKTAADLKDVSVDEALKHPKWNMGKKISIDSATLMNKGLEVIEAHWLFGVDYQNIDVVVHPQSIIHSMVQYNDSSVIAQLGSADMKLPIQYALNYPQRRLSDVKKLDFYELESLTFERPDMETFKCLKLAYEAGKTGGTMPTILNAANEAAVNLFINKSISFLEIGDIVEECMLKFDYIHKFGLNDILETDNKVRRFVQDIY